MMFWENAVGYLRNEGKLELLNICHCGHPPEMLLVGISGALGTKESHFLSKNVFWENAVGYLRNGEC